MSVKFGVEELLGAPGLAGGRVGLVTNAAARAGGSSEMPSRVALLRGGIKLIRLFSPEHGLETAAADGAAVGDGVDPVTGLPVISLYGARLRPSPAHLSDLDLVLFDVPDIGTRFYTYIWTLSHVLEACAQAGKPLVVLDRPNPLGGELSAAEGPLLDVEHCSSFLGRAAIPIRHSLTAGELARLWKAEWNLKVEVRVIGCTGWRRRMLWPDTGLPFVPTSPAITSFDAALLYPGLALFEATNLSVGRGSNVAFQVVGAPWLDAERLTARFNDHASPGVSAVPCRFVPTQNPWAGKSCSGVRLEVSQPKCFRPVAAGLLLLSEVLGLHRSSFRWSNYPTAANPGGVDHFERLIGRQGIREALERNPASAAGQVRSWTEAAGWRERVEKIFLYE